MSSFLNRTCRALSYRSFSTHLERWKDINGLTKYQVSSFGNVKSKKRNKVLRIDAERINGSATIRLISDSGALKWRTVSRLVLEAFLPTTNSESLFAIHIDGDRYNNKLDNLKWDDKFYPYTCNNGDPVRLQSIETGDIVALTL